MENLKEKIDKILSRRGLFVKDLSPLSGINPVTVNDIRQKGDCKISQLVKIANALNVDPCYFIHENSDIEEMLAKEPTTGYGREKTNPEVELLKKLLEEKDKRLQIYEKLESSGKL